MTESTVPRENIQKALETLEGSIEQATRAQLRIEWTLDDSRRRLKRIRANLRRAGLLRD